MNLGEQYLTKEMKKLLENAQKLVNSESMQLRIKQERAMFPEKKRAGLIAQFEQIQKQIVALAPQFIPKPEDIAHTKEKYSVRYKEPEPEPEPEPLTDKEIYLEAKENFQDLAQNFHGYHFDYETIWECADEMRYRTNQLEYDTYADAYRFAVKHYTVKGKPIKDIGSLENEFAKAKHKGRPLKSVPDQFK